MIDKNKGQYSEPAQAGDAAIAADGDQELTEQDLDLVDGGDGGQPTYPPYL